MSENRGGSLDGVVSIGEAVIYGEVSLPASGTYYTGTYDVNPDFIGVSLETRGKLLTQNVVVHPIKVEDVSNPQGGRTVYIGGIN